MLTINVPKVKTPPTPARYEWKVIHVESGKLATALNELESKTEWEIFSVSGKQIVLRRELDLPPIVATKDLPITTREQYRRFKAVVAETQDQELAMSLRRMGIVDRKGRLKKRYRA